MIFIKNREMALVKYTSEKLFRRTIKESIINNSGKLNAEELINNI